MTVDTLPAILEELAAGRIDAAEAARRIDALPKAAAAPAEEVQAAVTPPAPDGAAAALTPETPDDDAWAEATDRPQHPTHLRDDLRPRPEQPQDQPGTDRTEEAGTGRSGSARPVNTGGVERISVRAVGRRVRIVGETSVATLSADGAHLLRRNGNVLEVSSEGELGASLDGFSILRAPRSLEDIRALSLGKELFLRVNPAIVVDVEVTAGSLHTEQVPHLGKVRVTAGGAKLLDVEQVNDVLVQAGQATVKGAIKAGRNRIRAESGSVSVTLADDSNVTVTGSSHLGRVSWSGGHSGAVDEVVMGNGSAKLEVEVTMGHAQVRIGSEVPEGAKA